uniref:Insulin-like domain-containing protein n=1 Tax=Schizaphis graminum TaxID=13262 RepID=A0A2S2PU53_SCHGA
MNTLLVMTIILIGYLEIVMGTPLHPHHHNEQYMNRMQQFCGQHLTRELDTLCGGDFYDTNGSAHSMRKSITEECCSRQCSRIYIKMNFCRPFTEETLYTDSAVLNPIEEVDYLGYYFELLGRILEPIEED